MNAVGKPGQAGFSINFKADMSNVPTRVPSFTEKTASGENITIDPSRIQGGVNGLAAEVGRELSIGVMNDVRGVPHSYEGFYRRELTATEVSTFVSAGLGLHFDRLPNPGERRYLGAVEQHAGDAASADCSQLNACN